MYLNTRQDVSSWEDVSSSLPIAHRTLKKVIKQLLGFNACMFVRKFVQFGLLPQR